MTYIYIIHVQTNGRLSVTYILLVTRLVDLLIWFIHGQ